MAKYLVPFAYERYGRIEVEADSEEEAVKKASDELVNMSLIDMDANSDYLEDSAEIDEEGTIIKVQEHELRDTEWIKSDNLQWVKVESYNSEGGPVYDMIEVRFTGDAYCVVRGTVDVDEYPADEVASILQDYGYPDPEYVHDNYPDDYTHDDYTQVIAECLFESTPDDQLIGFGTFDSEDEAKSYVEKELL